jgi:hypothetical protein
MPRYPIGTHPLLSEEAAALWLTNQPRLEALGELAEARLGLWGTSYTGDEANLAAAAVAWQVNLMVEAGVDGDVYESVKRGSRSVTYRSGVAFSKTAMDLLALLPGHVLPNAGGVFEPAGPVR